MRPSEKLKTIKEPTKEWSLSYRMKGTCSEGQRMKINNG